MKSYSIISLIFLVCLSILPPIDFFVQNPPIDKWFWMVLIAGFFGVFTLFLKTNWFLRIIVIGGFVNCFFSCAPYLSFSSYVLLVLSCYFYIFASRIENWNLIFNVLKSILILNCILIFMQFLGRDTLLNFGLGNIFISNIDNVRIGTVGQHMQMSSFAVILSSILLSISIWFLAFPIVVSLLCHSAWGLFCSFAGLLFYSFFKNKKLFIILLIIFSLFLSFYVVKESKIQQAFGEGGRIPTWGKMIQLSNEHPFMGWGIGTYKNVFFQVAKLPGIPYKTAHNCWLEFAFEIGYVGMVFWMGLFGIMGFILFKMRAYTLLTGLIMVVLDMVGHFPTRQINCIPLLIIFCAFCERQVRIYGRK